MESQKITIELELTPALALMVGTYLHTTSQGDFTFHKMLSESGVNQMLEIAQSIVDQVCAKTDSERLRMENTQHYLTHCKDCDNLNELNDLLN